MKRLKLMIIIVLAFSLTGCMPNYNLTELQSDASAEFMAGLLLKYDDHYKPNLVSADEIIEEVEEKKKDVSDNESKYGNDANNSTQGSEEVTPIPSIRPPDDKIVGVDDKEEVTGDSKEKDYTLSEVINYKDFEIEYTGYTIVDSYPDDSKNEYFVVIPDDGKQLLVSYFSIENKATKGAEINLSKSKIRYQLDVNVGTIYKPQLTVLENDIQNINAKIGEGKTEAVLLIFEISKDADLSDINLMISQDNKTEIIEIK